MKEFTLWFEEFYPLFENFATYVRDVHNIPIANVIAIRMGAYRMDDVPFDLITKDLSMLAVSMNYASINYIPDAYKDEAFKRFKPHWNVRRKNDSNEN